MVSQFQYTDGSVIAALAVLETPNTIKAENPQPIALSEVGEVEGPFTGPSGKITRDESEDSRQFFWVLRQNFVRVLIHTLCGSFLGFAGLYFLSLAGFINMNLNDNIGGIFLPFAMTVTGSIFATPTSSNAVTSQRSFARRHLHIERESWSIFTGLDVFIVYMLLTGVILALAKPIFAQEGAAFPVFVISRLSLGLILTNIHTAWVHTVISKPTKKTIWQRIPSWREWFKILPVASLDIVLPSCVHYMATILLVSFRDVMFAVLSSQACEKIPSTLATCGNIAFFAIPIVSEYLASIFTGALYVRVAASILPDNDQSVVPFDRTFGGRARKETHCLSILDAFRSMKVQNWYRYLKIVWEVFCFDSLWACIFIVVIVMELYYWAPCTATDLLVLLAPIDF